VNEFSKEFSTVVRYNDVRAAIKLQKLVSG